jgi:hypothetical protein
MKTAVEWLAEKYDYAYWMVKRDEISPALAEEWKKHYLEQAKEMEKEQIIKHSLELAKILISNPYETSGKMPTELIDSYINKTFKSEE